MVRHVPLTRGKTALIDDDDWPLISTYKWHYSRTTGYPRSFLYVPEKRNNTAIYMHRLIMGLYDGKEHALNEVDHISHDKCDNRRENLRLCTHSQNCDNSRQHPGKTGYRGVWWDAKNGRYCVVITLSGKRKFLGRYDTLQDAVLVWNDAARRFKGEFAVLNPVPNEVERLDTITVPTTNRNNTSSFRGVSWDKKRNKWVARIGINYKYIDLGAYKTAIDAALAYDAAAYKLHGANARPNFPQKENRQQ